MQGNAYVLSYACPYFWVAPTATFYLSGGHN